jgi:hypothetical protein
MPIYRRTFLRYCALSTTMFGLNSSRASSARELGAGDVTGREGKGGLQTFPSFKRRIPFSLNGRSGSVTVSYGRNDDPVAAGFDIIPNSAVDINLCCGYPAVHAVIDTYNGTGYRTLCGWIQVVTEKYYNSYDGGKAPVKTFVLADKIPSMKDIEIPFISYGLLPQFFDAPCKNLYGQAKLWWVADTFLTTVPMMSKDEEISRLLGFRWGYVEYDRPEQRPVSPLSLKVTDGRAWNGHLPFLRKKFPKWRFTDATLAPATKS